MRLDVASAGFVVTSAAAYAVASLPAAVQGTGYIALHLALTCWMLLAWRVQPTPRTVLGAGILARVSLVGVAPFTTHDVERYVWDGAVTLAGYDPYQLPPAAPALAHLRDVWPTSAAHVDFTTIYPPGALGLFALAARAGPEHALLAWKGLVVAASVLTLVVAAALLRSRGLDRHLPLVALSPLLVLEGSVGAHLDAFATLAVALALLAVERGRSAVAGAALGCGGLIKFVPVLAALPLVVATVRRDRLALPATTVLVGAAGYVAAAMAGLWPFGGLGTFFAYARFGSPVAALAEAVAGAGVMAAAGVVVGVVLSIAALVFAARARVGVALQCALAAPLVASPVVYPWYLSPLIVVMALMPSAVVLIWTTTLPLTYEVLNELGASGRWLPARWPLVVIAVGWLVGVLVDTSRGGRRS